MSSFDIEQMVRRIVMWWCCSQISGILTLIIFCGWDFQGRAWLRMALMEKRLHDYITHALQQIRITRSVLFTVFSFVLCMSVHKPAEVWYITRPNEDPFRLGI